MGPFPFLLIGLFFVPYSQGQVLDPETLPCTCLPLEDSYRIIGGELVDCRWILEILFWSFLQISQVKTSPVQLCHGKYQIRYFRYRDYRQRSLPNVSLIASATLGKSQSKKRRNGTGLMTFWRMIRPSNFISKIFDRSKWSQWELPIASSN